MSSVAAAFACSNMCFFVAVIVMSLGSFFDSVAGNEIIIDNDNDDHYCFGAGKSLKLLADSSSPAVVRLASQWSEQYFTDCPGNAVIVEREQESPVLNNSDPVISSRPPRLCKQSASGPEEGGSSSLADLSITSRNWQQQVGGSERKDDEEKPTPTASDWQYACPRAATAAGGGGGTRNKNQEPDILQVQAALDAVVMVVQSGGAAHECISKTLGGLTVDQLRWMFSNYGEEELVASGDWQTGSIKPKNERSTSSRRNAPYLWSDLHDDCANAELVIAGPTPERSSSDGTTSAFVAQRLFKGQREGFATRNGTTTNLVWAQEESKVLDYVQVQGTAIGFVSHHLYYSRAQKEKNSDGDGGAVHSISTVAVRDPVSGVYVNPAPHEIARGKYQPFSRPLYVNVRNDPSALSVARPFISWALSSKKSRKGGADGDALASAGYVPLPRAERIVALTRLGAPGGIDADQVRATCPPPPPGEDGEAPPSSSSSFFSIAGSTTVYPIATAWAGLYTTLCPHVRVSVDSGGSSTGARRVCNHDNRARGAQKQQQREQLNAVQVRYGSTVTTDDDDKDGSGDGDKYAVDIGSMSRNWLYREASPGTDKDDPFYVYECGDLGDDDSSHRRVIQVEVAVEAEVVVTNKTGAAYDCIHNVLGGLTVDQLRWIFSGYTEELLTAYGWDPTSISNGDGDDNTHYWSELSADCSQTEIELVIPPGSNEFFVEVIFPGPIEAFAANRTTVVGELDAAVRYLTARDGAIAFFGAAAFEELSSADAPDQQDVVVAAVPIRNHAGQFVEPSADSIQIGAYGPLVHPIYMNLYRDEVSLAKTRPFIDLGLSDAGSILVEATGYTPLSQWDNMAMKTRAATPSGIPAGAIEPYCGPPAGFITIGGSSTVFPLATIWSSLYRQVCFTTAFQVEGGGSSDGAGRVCGDATRGKPVEIGDMSREWKATEATESMGFFYSCLKGDTSRSAIQVDIAVDGLTLAVGIGGIADKCIQILGGLTTDQLRWIFTSYTDEKLEETGWDVASLGNSDNDSTTHWWSELDPRCSEEEIVIAGPDERSGTYDFFSSTILTGEQESFGTQRTPNGYASSEFDELLVLKLNEDGRAISYFGYAHYYANIHRLQAVKIQNENGYFVLPSEDSIGGGSYPLSRRMYMNLLNDNAALAETAPFIRFALSPVGSQLTQAIGYVPLLASEKEEMIARLNNGTAYPRPVDDDGDRDGDSSPFTSTEVAMIAFCSYVGASLSLTLVVLVCFRSASSSSRRGKVVVASGEQVC